MNVNDWPLAARSALLRYLRRHGFRSERHKLFYVATPKVACTSLKWWFADLEGFARVVRGHAESLETDPDLIIHDLPHAVAPNVTGLEPDVLMEAVASPEYLRFAVVRNPYKRIFSAWQSKLLLREPLQAAPYLNCDFYKQPIESVDDIATAFERFLEHLAAHEAPNFLDPHWTPQRRVLRPDLIDYTKLVRIENKKQLTVALAARIGSGFVDPFGMRRANESLIPYLPQLLTRRSSELIRALYAEDFETFEYSDQPPDGVETFSDGQFEVALKGIHIVRGRNARFGELSRAVAERGAELQGIHASRSWRMTRLLRYVETVIRRYR